MQGLKISKMQVIDNPKEDAKIPIVQNGTNYSMPFGTLNKLITQIYEDYDIPNALQQLQIQIDSADAATAKAKDTAAHPGYVGNDGYYYKWNVETRTYEKTGVSLKGEKGDTFTFDDLTDEQVSVLMAPAIDAAAEATTAKQNADAAADAATTATDAANKAATNADAAADTAKSKADSAQAAANKAQSDANSALVTLSNITSDNILSPVKKSAERKEWNTIYAEKSNIDNQADTFGISRATYDDTFKSLASYLNAGVIWSEGVPNWLQDANLSSNTTIDGTTYRQQWSTFYTARTTLLNLIAEKARTLANSAQTAADSTAQELSEYQLAMITAINGLQSQIDGEVNSWFNQVDPTTSNAPASEWTTDILKQRHANDIYTNTNTGASWKWIQTNNVWGWIPIANTATQKALANAAKAQDTADGKRRVFTSQPTIASIYDIGDVWVNATYGTYKNDFLVCITAKATGAAFDIAHWQVASKYTDDTAAQDVKKYIDNNIIVPCGNWEPGTSYLKNRLVTFNNQTFISTTDTSDCTIVVLANENGDYLVDDGNYITPTDENGNITYNHSWKAYSSSEALEQDFAKFKKETSATLKILNDKINSILIRVNKLLG